MSESQDQEGLFRYLDAKFEAVHTKVDLLKTTWDAHDIPKRVANLETWRAYTTGAVAVMMVVGSGLVQWGSRLFFSPPGPK